MHIVLVLSIIGSGMSLLSYLLMGCLMPVMKSMFQTGAMLYPDEATVMLEQIFETPRSYYLSCALLYAMSLGGVLLMWKYRKSGFHLYTLAQLLVLLVTILFLGRERLMLGDVMLTLLFIIYYYLSLRTLGAFNSGQTAEEKAEGGEEE